MEVQMSDSERRRTFADETKTGRFRVESRGVQQALVAAQVDGRDYDWWLQFGQDFLPGIKEPKSSLIIPLMERDGRARDRLLDGLVTRANATIVIIDFSEHMASLVRGLYERVGIAREDDPFEVIAQGRLSADVTEAVFRYVRDTAIERSTVGRVEWLFQEALAGAPVILPDESGELVDRGAVRALKGDQQRELIARFSVTFGEALDPRRQADILARGLQEMRYFSSGHFAYKRLEETLAADRTFDEGSRPAFQILAEAHQKMADTLDQAMYGQLSRARPGTVSEEDSRNALGIQVADIAAAVASQEYELAQGMARQKAERVRAVFGRVLLNDEWI